MRSLLHRAGRLSGALLVLACGVACTVPRGDESERIVAQFGVLFGGQLRRVDELALELDRNKQIQGIRVAGPASRGARNVQWELGTAEFGRYRQDARGIEQRRRKTRHGAFRWLPGQPGVEQVLPFQPGDPTGLWSIRVMVDGQPVLDRPFWVFDAADRRDEIARQRERDGGI